MFKFIIPLYILISSVTAFGQSGVSRGARSQYASTAEITNGILHTTRITYEEYDKKGNVVLEIILNSDSTIKSKNTYQYNKKGNEILHTSFDGNNNILSKVVTTYDRFTQKKAVTKFSGDNIIIESTEFSYNNFGQKVSELTKDANGKQLKLITYGYDQRGALIERNTYSGDNTLTASKKYSYTY